jgi:hypothetical protein
MAPKHKNTNKMEMKTKQEKTKYECCQWKMKTEMKMKKEMQIGKWE